MRPAAIVIALVALCSTARADVPWAAGVGKDSQTRANALFAEANDLFARQAHAPALDRYAAAIALWDHPLIRFNMAVTLVRLDRFVEAADALDAALRFGDRPFPSPEQYRQALDYAKLVAGRVGTVEIRCEQEGVAVTLDGTPWLACPGTQARRVLAGEHVIVGEREGFLTVSRRIVVAGGATARETIALVPLERAVRLAYPSPRWMPWTVAGGGAAIAAGGLALAIAGQRQMDRADADFGVLCPRGCALDDDPAVREVSERRDAARLKGVIGASLLAAGGAIAAGGVVWVILNRPRRVLPAVELAPGGATAGVTASF